jgi:hypothetical protein
MSFSSRFTVTARLWNLTASAVNRLPDGARLALVHNREKPQVQLAGTFSWFDEQRLEGYKRGGQVRLLRLAFDIAPSCNNFCLPD